MNLLSKIWRRMFRSQSTEDEAMPEQDLAPVVPTPAALGIPATAVAAPVAGPATQVESLAPAKAEAAVAGADAASLSITINHSVDDIDALKAAIAADTAAGRLSVIEAAPAAPVAERADFVERQLNTDTMRDLLKALGHDIGDVWDDVVKLAKKAI